MDTPGQKPKPTTSSPAPDRLTRVLRGVVIAIGAVVVLGAAWVGLAYAFSPEALRHPHGTHYHFRLQVIDNGMGVNFADDKFQTPFNTDICNVALTKEPIHFHDKLDQFVHIHWAGVTGGLFLKNYGWNFVNGPDDTLGYRFDQLPRLVRVPIHGQSLPKPSPDANYYLYTGDEHSYKQRDWKVFLSQDLRDFFAGKQPTSFLDAITPTASAHGGVTGAHSEEELAKLNDVLGSAVIFVQKDAPTDAQIKDRFNHLIALPESSCAG